MYLTEDYFNLKRSGSAESREKTMESTQLPTLSHANTTFIL
jgi:hypothetical protein